MKSGKKTRFRRILALPLFSVLLFMLFAFPIAAAGSGITEIVIGDKNPAHYGTVKIRYGDQTLTGLLIANTTYVPLRAFGENVLGAKVTYDRPNRKLTVTRQGLTLAVTDGCYYTEANGRYLYAATPAVIMNDGRMYIPVRVAAKACGLSVGWSGASRTATLSGKFSFLQSGSTYYDAGEVYWLSRIISAEARGEPLTGQIAVGRVVLNRVASPLYPNTVYGVIFDRLYGVQFTPVADGSIYASPTASSVIAAKIALEGDVLTEPVLFFMEPRKSVSRWIQNNRAYAYTIGHHDFYY